MSRRFGYSDQLLIYTLGVLIRQYRSLNQAWLFASDTPGRQSHIVYTLPLRYSASDTQSWIFKLISRLLTQPHGSQSLLTYSRGLLSALRRSPFSYVASDNKARILMLIIRLLTMLLSYYSDTHATYLQFHRSPLRDLASDTQSRTFKLSIRTLCTKITEVI